jgi:hypothetical protein
LLPALTSVVAKLPQLKSSPNRELRRRRGRGAKYMVSAAFRRR